MKHVKVMFVTWQLRTYTNSRKEAVQISFWEIGL